MYHIIRMNFEILKTLIKVLINAINISNGRTDPMFLVKVKNSVMLLHLQMELLLLLLVLLKAKRFNIWLEQKVRS